MIRILLLLLAGSTVWAQKPIVRQELIFPPQEKHVHGSSLVELSNGDFLAVWFYGSGERTADDVRIQGARLKKGAQAWSAPFDMADTPHLPDCNPVLFLNQEGRLFLVWIAVQANQWEYSLLRYKTSVDYLKDGPPVWNHQDNIFLKPGQEFADEVAARFRELPSSHEGWAGYAPKYDDQIREAARDAGKRSIGWMTRIKPLLLPNGRIILPLYSDGYNLSLMALSDDKGATWLPGRPLVGRGPIQPALARKKNGTIVAYARDSGTEPTRVHISESADNGQSWTASRKTDIPNTASVELLVLQNGKWAFLGNDIDNGRHILSLYLSDDEGRTWKSKTRIEDHPEGKGSYSYPCLIQSADGLLHLTYSHHTDNQHKSIKHVVVDPQHLIP